MENVAETHHDGYAHVSPLSQLVLILCILLFFTFLTVAATWVDLGAWNLWIGMIIATIKAVLVAMYFMHLRFDSLFNTIIFFTGIVLLALFIGITLTDVASYQPDITDWVRAKGG